VKTALTLAHFHLLSVWNWRTTYLSRLLEAPAYFLFMVAGLTALAAGSRVEGMGYEDFAYAGVLVVIAIRALFWTMGDVANDRKWGTYAIARTISASFTEYVSSVVAANGAVAAAQILLIWVLKQLVARGSALRDLEMAGLALAVSLLTVLGGCALGFAVNSYSKRDLLTSLFSLPLVLTAPLFFSVQGLPGYMRVLTDINPFTYFVRIVRAPALGQVPGSSLTGAAVSLAVVVAALLVIKDRHELSSNETG
jgi:ABC-2 type transport system permease protein